MRKYLYIFVILVVLLPGCSFAKKKEPSPKPQTSQDDKKPAEDKKDYIIGLQTPVKGAKEWAERYKRYEGVYGQKKGDYRLVLITQGEKFAKGYEVSVPKVEKANDKWVIGAKIIRPQEEDYAGGSVYPYEIVSIIDDGKPIEVVQSEGSNSEMAENLIEIPEGKEFAVSKNFIVFSPLEGEKVGNPVTIRGKARIFEANFRIVIEDGHNVLAEKVMMSDAGAPAWGNFSIDLPYEKATNPSGHIIFSYENMENGSMVEELILPVKF